MQTQAVALVAERLQTAAVQKDVVQRISLLLQAQEILLHTDTSVETVDACLEQFLSLQADPQPAARRYVAHFIERLMRFKPSFAAKCIPGLLVLLRDTDSKAREAAARAASILHPRVLYSLAVEEQAMQFQRAYEHLQELQEAMREILHSGCPQQPRLFGAATKWAKVQVLTQTPSSVAAKIRIPPELRGVSCLDELPVKVRDHGKGVQFDAGSLKQQAEDLVVVMCQLVEQPPKGRWSRAHMGALVHSMVAIGRQRPMFLRQILDTLNKVIVEVNAAMTGRPSALGQMSVVPADAPHLQQLVQVELQSLLSSQLTVDRHGEIMEMLQEIGHVGTVEDLVVQAKYDQIRRAVDRPAAEEPSAKRAKHSAIKKLAWVPEGDAVFGDADCFDADALISGEIEETLRSFELHFGIPSQREPAGHVTGPALLTTRSKGVADLARLSLMSLSSISEKRTLMRDRVHERIINMEDVIRARSAAAVKTGAKGRTNVDSQVSKFLGPDVPDLEERGAEGEVADPRLATKALQLMDASMSEVADETPEDQLLAIDPSSVRLPTDVQDRDNLQVQLFQEIMEASKRLASSLTSATLSDRQLQTFDFVHRQVSLHLAASIKLSVNPDLQRAMCRCYLTHAFDMLKGGDGRQLDKLIELFYAKFSADIACAQAVQTLTESKVQEIIEGTRANAKVFSYAELFDMFVVEFERRNLTKKELRMFLSEIPAVPSSAFRMLEAQCHQTSTRKVALLTVLALIENRPACRWQCLHLLFKLAYSPGDDTELRFDTIRLIINKIYNVEVAASARYQLPHLADDEAVVVTSKAPRVSCAAPEHEFAPLSNLRGRYVEDIATLMLRSMAPSNAKFAFKVEVPPQIEQLVKDVFTGAVCSAKDRVWLYLALCIKRPVLLHVLVETFTLCEDEMKEHLINSIEEAIKHIPSTDPDLLVLVQKATFETERLVLKVLHILISPDKEGLPRAFGDAVTRLYGETQNPRLLVPVFGLLERRRLLDFLPAVVQLDKEEVTNAFQQLIRSKAPPLSNSELLTELHHLNKPKEHIVPVKCSIEALNAMFEMREQFDAKVYGIVIQSLVEESGPLPTLFMRTVIRVVQDLPRMGEFVVTEILPRLVRQDVFNDTGMWKGFVLVLQNTFNRPAQQSGASRVLAMLPHAKLEDVLVQHPDWKAHLREWVAKQPPGAVAPHVRQLLQ